MSDKRQSLWRGATASAAALLALASLTPSPSQAQMNDKWITVVLDEEPITLDGCHMTSSTVGRVTRQNIAESLTEIDPQVGTITPRLATSWQRINDLTWRFKLREGVKFHDGTPFNAKNAAWGIWRSMETNLNCEAKTKSFGDLKIKGVPVDDYTLDIVTDKPEPILPTRMGVVGMVGPGTDTTKFVRNPVGTGPYTFVKWDEGVEIHVKRNESYWGAKPQIEGVRYVWRKESAVRAAMVKVGEADFAANIALQDANEPTMDSSYLNAETTKVRIEMGRKPLDDIRVRLALNYAVDLESFRGTVLPKDVIRATQIIVPSIAGHNHEIDKKLRPYDPAKAKQLLREAKAAGTAVDTELTFLGRTAHFPNSNELMEGMLAMWQAAGFNVKMKFAEVAVWREAQNKPYSPDRPPLLFFGMHDNNNGDAVFSLYNKLSCSGFQSFICDPALDEKIVKAAGLSGPERNAAWAEINRIAYEDMVTHVWVAHMVGYSRVGKRIDFKPSITTNSEVQIAQMKLK